MKKCLEGPKLSRHAATYFCLGGQSTEKGHFKIKKGHFSNFPQGAFRPSAFTHPFDCPLLISTFAWEKSYFWRLSSLSSFLDILPMFVYRHFVFILTLSINMTLIRSCQKRRTGSGAVAPEAEKNFNI